MMKVIVYSTKNFEKPFLQDAFAASFDHSFTDKALSSQTAILASGFEAVCIFTNDDASALVLKELHGLGVKHIAVRAAGYDNVDLTVAEDLGISVANVPEYSPYAIAEHTIAMILALNRKLVLGSKQVHRLDFTLDRLVGFDLKDKYVGIIGTGRIGKVLAKILYGFGCNLLAFDKVPDPALSKNYGVRYGSLDTLCVKADIISINLPLTKQTHHLINANVIRGMKKGVMLINTARGSVLHTAEAIEFIKNGHIGYLGLDVYENEKGVFFYDHSREPISDPLLAKLIGFENVLITPHQAFATKEALANIADTTFHNLQCWQQKRQTGNELTHRNVLLAKAL